MGQRRDRWRRLWENTVYNEHLARAEYEYRMERFLADARQGRLAAQGARPGRLRRMMRRLGTRHRPLHGRRLGASVR
ncbi:hypothetical protein ACFQ3B_13865 [Stackebrandtia endophytica]|uniref:hypothetical protein n=1 Tax=Stackebrandtia endophytica TaxID=1496996 RepID=UPI0011519FF8|nr:hypothetical protein [Stackebrandtia endophytica]